VRAHARPRWRRLQRAGGGSSREAGTDWALFFGFRPLSEELHIRSAATSLASEPEIASPLMEAIMSITGTAIAVFLGAAGICVIVCVIHGHAAVDPAPVIQPLAQQPMPSATQGQRESDRQQLNRYFLQNWRDRPTRPNLY